MFDEIKIFMDCPYCGGTINSTAQTKDLDNCMAVYDSVPEYAINDFLKKESRSLRDYDRLCKAPSTQFNYVNVIIGCHSTSCQFDADRRDLISQSMPSGFGRHFEGKLLIKKGCFLSRLKDVELDGHDEKYFAKYKKDPKVAKKLKKLLPKFKNQEVIAVRNWGWD